MTYPYTDGIPGVTTPDAGGNSIYSDGGPGGSSIYGAVICETFTCSGGSSVHYDQGLSGGDEFRITSWREL